MIMIIPDQNWKHYSDNAENKDEKKKWSSGWYNTATGKSQDFQTESTSYWRSDKQRWGKRGGKHAAYYTARAHAKNKGEEYLRWFDSQYSKDSF